MPRPLSVFTGEVAPVASNHGERWGKFTHSACADRDLSLAGFRVLCAIASYGDSTDATDKMLAERAGLAWRSVPRPLTELVTRGYVRRETTTERRWLTLVQVFAGTAPSADQRQGVQIFERSPSARQRCTQRSPALPHTLASVDPYAAERHSLEALEQKNKQRAAGAGPEPSGRAGRPPLLEGSPPAPAVAPPGRGGQEDVDRVEVTASIRELVERSKAEPPPARPGRSRVRSAPVVAPVPVSAEPVASLPRPEDRLTVERLDFWIEEQRSPHPSMRLLAARAIERHYEAEDEFGELGSGPGGHGCQVLPTGSTDSGASNYSTGDRQNSQDLLTESEHNRH